MEELASAHDLLIAVDCGTLAFEPIAAAKAKGAEVIVADHHLAAETLPDCAAVGESEPARRRLRAKAISAPLE